MRGTVIFDLDGTLLNTLGDLAYSMNKSLEKLGLPTHPTEAYRYFVGNGVIELARGVLPEGMKNDENIARLLDVYNVIYAENQFNTTAPYDGIADAVKKIKQAGFKVCVLSNKPDANTKPIVARFFGDGLFDEVMGKCENFPRKPDPSAALYLIGKTGAHPDDCFFVGDSGTDMKTGCNAGIKTVGVLWGFREIKELTECGGKYFAGNADELVKIIVG